MTQQFLDTLLKTIKEHHNIGLEPVIAINGEFYPIVDFAIVSADNSNSDVYRTRYGRVIPYPGRKS